MLPVQDTSPTPPLEQFLTYRLHLVNKLTDKHSSDAYAKELGLGVGEARCLAAIGNALGNALADDASSKKSLSINELAAGSNLNKAQASRAAQALVARGLAHKGGHETDGRGVAISLSEAGAALWQQVMQLIAKRNASIFSCLSEAEKAQLGNMLDKIAQNAR
ncbi:MAG: MarR family winged helix-turn-helix transcriptional regulator [Burkholderiaceae bacterium]|nr:MarR family winged helix-turn-helix transcriptional regulator [Burkholderiaceae bacterium]